MTVKQSFGVALIAIAVCGVLAIALLSAPAPFLFVPVLIPGLLVAALGTWLVIRR